MFESIEDYEFLMETDVRDEERRLKWASASEETWREIIERYPEYRATVAVNVTLPASIQLILAKDEDERVRMELAGRRRLSPEVFEILAADAAQSVRCRVCYNRKLPESLLVKLLEDPDSWVEECAREGLEMRRKSPGSERALRPQADGGPGDGAETLILSESGY